MVSTGGGAPSIGGDPTTALIALAILLVVGYVVWKVAS